MKANPLVSVICGFFDSGKGYIIEHIKLDNSTEYLPDIDGLYTNDIDHFNAVEKVINDKKVCLIKPNVKEQYQYLNLNIINARKKLLFIFRHPGISWFINQHKLRLMSKGESYSKLINQYIIGFNSFYKRYIDFKKDGNYLGVNFEKLLENEELVEKVSNNLGVMISNLSNNGYSYLIEQDLDKIKESINLVTQEDLDLIYDNLSSYMKCFNYERLSLSTIMYQFANMLGYDSIVECLANIKKCIAVDLDGTLAKYEKWRGISYIGEPIQSVVDAALKKQSEGYEIVIFTARVMDPRAIPIIRNWLRNNKLPYWRITNVKDSSMKEIWDDLAVHVERNRGFNN